MSNKSELKIKLINAECQIPVGALVDTLEGKVSVTGYALREYDLETMLILNDYRGSFIVPVDSVKPSGLAGEFTFDGSVCKGEKINIKLPFRARHVKGNEYTAKLIARDEQGENFVIYVDSELCWAREVGSFFGVNEDGVKRFEVFD